jgi:polysaccharide export outer membrane protein
LIPSLLGVCLAVFAWGCASTPSSDAETDAVNGASLQMRLPGRDARSGAGEEEDMSPALAAGLLPGGEASSGVTYRLRTGDTVSINFRGIPRPFEIIEEVDENGYIKLQYINRIQAVGLTSAQLEDAIYDAYVPDYYRSMTVSVFVASQSYFVRGEVRRPGRFPLGGTGVTLLQAIATSGGYTDYANPRRVEILRAGAIERHNIADIERNPEMDVPVIAGDVVIVRRKFF